MVWRDLYTASTSYDYCATIENIYDVYHHVRVIYLVERTCTLQVQVMTAGARNKKHVFKPYKKCAVHAKLVSLTSPSS